MSFEAVFDPARDLLDGAFEGDVDKVLRAIKEGATVNQQDEGGRSALHLATAAGNVGVIDVLLLAGAIVNIFSHNMSTPLHYAAWHGRLDCATRLIMAGADIHLVNGANQTPLQIFDSMTEFFIYDDQRASPMRSLLCRGRGPWLSLYRKNEALDSWRELSEKLGIVTPPHLLPTQSERDLIRLHYDLQDEADDPFFSVSIYATDTNE
jgi:hypothetical protein